MEKIISNIEDERLDIYLSQQYPQCSRSYIKTLIDKSCITVNSKIVKADRKSVV